MVYRILSYLKLTPDEGLFFKKDSDREVKIYSDEDWARSIIGPRSITGFYLYMGNLVTLEKQKPTFMFQEVMRKLNFVHDS